MCRRGGRNTQSNYMKMGIYPLPPLLYQQIREKKDLLKLYPVLGEIICPQNYTQKFDMLLHLEEIQLCVDLQQFNLHDACLQHAGQFLSLELPGLAEGRPSLLVGDRALLTLPGSMEAEDKLTVYEGCIHEVHKDSIRLMFHPDFHAKYNGESYDISFEFNRSGLVASTLCFSLCKTPNNKLSTIWGDQQPVFTRCLDVAVLFPPLSMDLKPPVFTLHEWFNPHLNQRQKDAVLRILENQSHLSPYVVFGPPGTGKTLTLVETVVQITHTMPHARVLVCAPSNSAADLIAMKLIKTNGFDGSDIVRLNAFQRKEEVSMGAIMIPDLSSQHSIEYITALYGLYISSLAISIMEGLETYCKVGQDLSMLVRQRLVVTTCTNAGLLYRMQLPESHFSHILIDEAGQATEPETLIPILLSLSAQVVLAGDHKQLGPIVRSFVARNSGLQLSLMERIMTRHCYQPDPDHYAETGNYNPYLVTKLIDNYRSVPDLVEMPSRMFYDNQLVCHYTGGEEFQKLSQSKIFPTPGFPIVFHGVQVSAAIPLLLFLFPLCEDYTNSESMILWNGCRGAAFIDHGTMIQAHFDFACNLRPFLTWKQTRCC
ncbi:MOV10L1 [Cordylochernes scorpioides]|uniref:MOV10L1 n=1 Tax=Cordylochernes scorpioides TaxID=51811 RepID=A0ABY6K592_9ARAC|nr:MOV10L1 [Cordylochernes scorpioides]